MENMEGEFCHASCAFWLDELSISTKTKKVIFLNEEELWQRVEKDDKEISEFSIYEGEKTFLTDYFVDVLFDPEMNDPKKFFLSLGRYNYIMQFIKNTIYIYVFNKVYFLHIT